MPVRKHKYRLRNRLAVLVTSICVLALLVEGIALILIETRDITTSTRADIEYTLSKTNEDLAAYFRLISGVVRDVRASMDLSQFWTGQYDANAVQQQLSYIADLFAQPNSSLGEIPFLERVTLFNLDGGAVSTAYTPTTQQHEGELLGAMYSHNQTLHSMEKNYLVLSDREQIYVLTRVYDSNYALLGTICFTIKCSAIETILASLNQYSGIAYTLCIGEESLCGSGDEVLLASDASDWLGEGEITLGNRTYLANGISLPFGLKSVAAVPKSEITKIIRPTILALMLVVAIIVPLISIVALALLRRAMRPLRDIAQKIRLFGEGDFDTQFAPYDAEEFDHIASTFNDMTSYIKRLITENYETKLIAQENEIKFLQSQIDPHFMFNVLTMIALSAKENQNEEEYRMLVSLARLMRGKVFQSDKLTSTLGEELALVDYYLLLQCGRYSGRIQYRINCPNDLKSLSVPRLTVEPIAENAFLHGVEPKGIGTILITAEEKDGALVVTVSDDGLGFEPNREQTSQEHIGIGLSNTSKLLKNLYGDDYGVSIDSKPGEGATIAIRFPVMKEG